MSEIQRFVTHCEEDEEGNLVLAFPDDLLDLMGWGEGTDVEISTLGDSIIIRSLSEIQNESHP